MSTTPRTYKDTDGNPCPLLRLIKSEPEWAENQILHRDRLEAELAAFSKGYVDSAQHNDIAKKLAAVTAERDALRIEYESRAIWIRKMLEILGITNDDGMNCVDAHEHVAQMKAERDALKAKLATINHIAMSLFVRNTSCEVTGEMAEIGRLSREDGQ